LLFSLVLAASIGVLAAGPSFAADADLTTPEGAVAAYIGGIARQDFSAIIAASSVENESRRYDFVAHVDRLKILMPRMLAPASAPLFIEMNKAEFTVRIARQVQSLIHGLMITEEMATKEMLNGKSVPMDAAGAVEFASVVRADRLASLALVKVGIPKPQFLSNEKYQAHLAAITEINGADAATERMALISFEGLDFVIGFTLLRYGENWAVLSQSSMAAAFHQMGVPGRMTPEAFEALLQ
jgi:hypothetical protein